jgi:hypothetical protein
VLDHRRFLVFYHGGKESPPAVLAPIGPVAVVGPPAIPGALPWGHGVPPVVPNAAPVPPPVPMELTDSDTNDSEYKFAAGTDDSNANDMIIFDLPLDDELSLDNGNDHQNGPVQPA